MVIDSIANKQKIARLEADFKSVRDSSYTCPRFHLMPPVGWLNDPNGLCQIDGLHHIFFQYSPFTPVGGDKYWGHYTTYDYVTYAYEGIFLSPDTPYDKDGVFSGSAISIDGQMHVFYTGNVEGLEASSANTIKVLYNDGQPSEKKIVIGTEDYPNGISNQVRDPKVFFEGGVYYMVLGASTCENKGAVLLYQSKDLDVFEFKGIITTEDAFGYMWECPDVFRLGSKQFMSFSPQGLAKEAYRFQNKYQSGYLPLGVDQKVHSKDFVEWDYGFDFYAPQTYQDEKGRRILIGWMGVSDQEYNHDPSIEAGWQHMLTMARELVLDEHTGIIRQQPLEEYEKLRGKAIELDAGENQVFDTYELVVSEAAHDDFELIFDGKLNFIFDKNENVFVLKFMENGFGRTKRILKVREDFRLCSLRIFVDKSSVEIFINEGLYVFTTKFFLDISGSRRVENKGKIGSLICYQLDRFNVDYIN